LFLFAALIIAQQFTSIQSMLIMCDMHEINLAGVDLNLLVALDALLEERSVTRAGARLGLSQSATSHALKRLRALLDDPLFIQTSAGLRPTPRAERLRQPLMGVLSGVRSVLRPAPFNPAAYRGPIGLAAVDYQSYQLLPSLLARLATEAPLANVNVVAAGADVAQQLESRHTDVALIGAFEGSSFRRVRLFNDGFVCVARTGHPGLAEPLTPERFAALDHCFLTITGRGDGAVDAALARLGLERRILLRLPHFLAAPLIVAESDLVLTLPRLLADRLARLVPLQIVSLPFEVAGYDLNLVWHEHVDAEPDHIWLRGLIRECAAYAISADHKPGGVVNAVQV
jgi:DNA-binding transcriptional LysR family regulator